MTAKYSLILLLVAIISACDADPAERMNTGNSAFQHGDYASALQAYQSAQVALPDYYEAYFNAGNTYALMGEYEKAIISYEIALRTNDAQLQANIFYNLGNVNYLAYKFDRAVDAYKHVLLLIPNDDDARHNLEVALAKVFSSTPTPITTSTEDINLRTATPDTRDLASQLAQPSISPTRSTSYESQYANSTHPVGITMSVEEAIGILDAAQQSQPLLPESTADASIDSTKDW